MKNIYLKLRGPDVAGESMDSQHDQWIELTGMNHEMSQPASRSPSTAGGHAVGRTEHGDILCVKDLDLASPSLYQAVSGGKTYESAVIEFYRASGGGKRVKYLQIELKNVLVAKVALGIDDALLPTETISLRYAAIQWTYEKQKIDGGAGGKTMGAWSLTKNDKIFSV